MSTLVIRIVPASFIKIPSPDATAVVPLEVPPSIKFNSAAVDVTAVPPSFKAFNAVVPAKFTSVNKSNTAPPDPAPSEAIILTSPAATATLAPDPCEKVSVYEVVFSIIQTLDNVLGASVTVQA